MKFSPKETAILEALAQAKEGISLADLSLVIESASTGSTKVLLHRLRRKGIKISSPRMDDPKGSRIGVAQIYRLEKQQRMARCPSCDKTVPSNPDLPFFVDRSEGSSHAVRECHCGYYIDAHGQSNQVDAHCAKIGKGIGPRGPHEFDSFYCGCEGLD